MVCLFIKNSVLPKKLLVRKSSSQPLNVTYLLVNYSDSYEMYMYFLILSWRLELSALLHLLSILQSTVYR